MIIPCQQALARPCLPFDPGWPIPQVSCSWKAVLRIPHAAPRRPCPPGLWGWELTLPCFRDRLDHSVESENRGCSGKSQTHAATHGEAVRAAGPPGSGTWAQPEACSGGELARAARQGGCPSEGEGIHHPHHHDGRVCHITTSSTFFLDLELSLILGKGWICSE